MKATRMLAGSIVLAHLLTVSNAYSYGRQTHQRITELAYGIMKQMEYCQPSQAAVSLIEECQERCDANTFAKDVAQGASLDSLRQRCKESCLDSYAVMGPNQDMPTDAGVFEEMEALGLDPRYCRIYEPAYAKYKNGNIRKIHSFNESSRNSLYFQRFRSPACPDQTNYSHIEDPGCSNYELPELSGGFTTDAAPFYRPLSSHTRAQYGGKLVLSSADPVRVNELTVNFEFQSHEPMISPNLIVENYVDRVPGSIIDYTGTILGYYSGSTDLFEDVFTEIKILPLVWDVFKTFVEGTAVVVGTAAAVIWAVGAVVVCAVSCAFKLFGGDTQCKTCFSGNFSDIVEYAESIQDAVRDVEETNLTSIGSSAESFGNHNASLSHFMNSPIDYQNAIDVFASASAGTPPNPFEIIGLFFEHDDV